MARSLDLIRKYLNTKPDVDIHELAKIFSIPYWHANHGSRIYNAQLLEHYYTQRYFIACNDLEEKFIRPLRKLATEEQVQGAYGAKKPNVHEDLSTGVTTQLPSEVEFPKRSIVISNAASFLIEQVESFSQDQIFVTEPRDFDEYLTRYTSFYNTHNAINSLQNNTNFHSAKSLDYEKMVTGFITIFFALMYFSSNIFNILTGLFYLIQNLLKSVLFLKGFQSGLTLFAAKDPQNIQDKNLPIYSILIPLYKEEFKIESILKAISQLNYPPDKLDVKFILEEDDVITNQAIITLKLPSYVQVIKVPYSLPRTKPKALNYAMPFTRGQYLTIYDAEDEPEPEQLRKAVAAFAGLPEDYVCVQAKLNFYNAHHNLLTRLFSIEYHIWFGYLLKGLSLIGAPVPLGGTSNHFKLSKLKEVGLWDAYNVTEDADLGIRLYLQGYKVYMIDSITMEEAPHDIFTWIGQRARWIKGFIQTIGVFMKTDINHQIFGLKQALVVYIFVGLSIYNFIFFPWLLVVAFMELHQFVYYFWLLNSVLGVCYIYFTAYIALSSRNSFVKLNNPLHYLVLLIWPLYFILHSFAAYRALWELVKAPFQWNKTPHGSYEELQKDDDNEMKQ